MKICTIEIINFLQKAVGENLGVFVISLQLVVEKVKITRPRDKRIT